MVSAMPVFGLKATRTHGLWAHCRHTRLAPSAGAASYAAQPQNHGKTRVGSHGTDTHLQLLQQQRLRIQKNWQRRLQLLLQRPTPLQLCPVAYGEPGGAVAHTLQSLQRMQAPTRKHKRKQRRQALLCRHTQTRCHGRTGRLSRV